VAQYVAVADLAGTLFMATGLALEQWGSAPGFEDVLERRVLGEIALNATRNACRCGATLAIRHRRDRTRARAYAILSLLTDDAGGEEHLQLLADGLTRELPWHAVALDRPELDEALAIEPGSSVVRLSKAARRGAVDVVEVLPLACLNSDPGAWSALLLLPDLTIDFGVFPLEATDIPQVIERTLAAGRVWARRDPLKTARFESIATMAEEILRQGIFAGAAVTIIGRDLDAAVRNLPAFDSPLLASLQAPVAWHRTAGREDAEELAFMALDYSEERQQIESSEPDPRCVFALASSLAGAATALYARRGTLASRSAAAAAADERGFDVFLSHNSNDKPAVRRLADALESKGVRVWLDERELKPGGRWQNALEQVVESVRSAAVLVGADGLGPWEEQEMRICLWECVERGLPVIPVLLPGAPLQPALPLFLKQFTWVDLRTGFNEEGLALLVWGIRGVKAAP